MTYHETKQDRRNRLTFQARIRSIDGETEVQFYEGLLRTYQSILKDDRRRPEWKGMCESVLRNIWLVEQDLGLVHQDLQPAE